jgi:tRNA A37 methylthiotransferase MiaB
MLRTNDRFRKVISKRTQTEAAERSEQSPEQLKKQQKLRLLRIESNQDELRKQLAGSSDLFVP